jgi:dihydropyrimidinase
MKADLVVRNAIIVLPESGPTAGDLVVKNGHVEAIGVTPKGLLSEEILDADGCLVFPGLIDPHIHCGWVPPLEDRMRAESAFGISGGITTFIRYVRHPESYLEMVDAQIELGNKVHYQDYALHLTIFNHDQVSEIPEYVQKFGVTSFKLYTHHKGRLGRGILMDIHPDADCEDPQDVNVDTALLKEIFRTLQRLPVRCCLNVHCEDGDLLAHGIEQARRLGLEGLAAWNYACSDLAEALAISQVTLLSRTYRVPVYFPHIGSRAAIRALREARICGTDFVAETGPHYLTLTTDCRSGVLAKVMPPIRTLDDQKAAWQALDDGLIETIGSDHVAFTLAEKKPTDIWSTRTAFPGTGLILPLLLSQGLARKRLSLQQLARITSLNAARTFGLYPRKGTLLPGSDADFVMVDPDRTWQIKAKDWLSAADFNIYEGMEVKGAVKSVYLRGVKVFEDGRLVGEQGRGRYLRRDR